MRKGLSVKVLQTGDILQTSFAKSQDEMKSENENNRLICKVILSSPCLWAWFHPLYPNNVQFHEMVPKFSQFNLQLHSKQGMKEGN